MIYNPVALIIFMTVFSVVAYHGGRSTNNPDSLILAKLSPKWKKILRLDNPDRELYNIFSVFFRIYGCVLLLYCLLCITFLQFFFEFKLLFELWIVFFFSIALLMMPLIIIDMFMCWRIRKKWKNALLNKFASWVLIDKEGIKDITLQKMRFLRWQDIKHVRIGSIATKRNKTKSCIFFSADEILDTNLSRNMINDELFIVDYRRDLIDTIIDFAPSEKIPDFSPEWYIEAFSATNVGYGKKRISAAKIYRKMAIGDSNDGNYNRALQWHKKELAITEKVLGKEHSDTAIVRSKIAIMYKCQGLYIKSLNWYIESYRGLAKTLGEAHTVTISVKNNMEIAYREAELTEPFEEWIEKLLALPCNSEDKTSVI